MKWQTKMQGVLDSLVIDTVNDHNTQDTARRVAKMYVKEVFTGRYTHAPALTEFPNAEYLNELMIVGPITVRSACSHHLCPVIGKLWVGVLPNKHIQCDWPVQVRPPGRLDHGPPANPGRGHRPTGRHHHGKNPTRWLWLWSWNALTFACPGAAYARWTARCSTPSCAVLFCAMPTCGASS